MGVGGMALGEGCTLAHGSIVVSNIADIHSSPPTLYRALVEKRTVLSIDVTPQQS